MRPVRRVLVVHPYGIGDLLFVTPVLRALRLLAAVEKVDLVLGSRTEAIVRSNPHVDEIFIIDKDQFHRQSSVQTFHQVTALGKKLRENRYDLLIDYSLRQEYAFFGQFILGIPQRAGFDYKGRGFFHNIRVPIPEGFKDRPVADYYSDLAEEAGVPVDDRFLEFYLSEEARIRTDNLFREKGITQKRILAVAPGGGESWGKDAHFKQWPVQFFADLIRRLPDLIDFDEVILLGSGKEASLTGELERLLRLPCHNFTGKMGLEGVGAILERAVLFVGNDSGLVHMAHALRSPVIAFYGPADPRVYGPYPATEQAVAIWKKDLECRPCYQNFRYPSDCASQECLSALSCDEVFGILKTHAFFGKQRPPKDVAAKRVK